MLVFDKIVTLNDSADYLDLHRQRSLEGNDLAVQAINTLLNSQKLIPVALVTCNADNDDLFRLTNSFNDFWGNNKEVELLANADQGFCHQARLVISTKTVPANILFTSVLGQCLSLTK